jgi:hypothetical protein
MVILDGDGTEPPGHPSGKNYDFRFEPSRDRRFIKLRNGAVVAKPTAAPGGLSNCMKARFEKVDIRIDNLPFGSCLCVRTNEGRYSELRLDGLTRKGANVVEFSYTIWEK